ncbi:glycosyltransferase, partial [Candidatus Parcubacteria bacterium]
LYANTYLFVQPSDYEGLSVALLEAMSHGAAVLVSNIEANLETVKDAGFVFAAGDVIDLTDKIRYLLSNPAAVAIKKEESILVVKKYYTWDKIAEEVESVYITARH